MQTRRQFIRNALSLGVAASCPMSVLARPAIKPVEESLSVADLGWMHDEFRNAVMPTSSIYSKCGELFYFFEGVSRQITKDGELWYLETNPDIASWMFKRFVGDTEDLPYKFIQITKDGEFLPLLEDIEP